jgi:hypothetical protein
MHLVRNLNIDSNQSSSNISSKNDNMKKCVENRLDTIAKSLWLACGCIQIGVISNIQFACDIIPNSLGSSIDCSHPALCAFEEFAPLDQA